MLAPEEQCSKEDSADLVSRVVLHVHKVHNYVSAVTLLFSTIEEAVYLFAGGSGLLLHKVNTATRLVLLGLSTRVAVNADLVTPHVEAVTVCLQTVQAASPVF